MRSPRISREALHSVTKSFLPRAEDSALTLAMSVRLTRCQQDPPHQTRVLGKLDRQRKQKGKLGWEWHMVWASPSHHRQHHLTHDNNLRVFFYRQGLM